MHTPEEPTSSTEHSAGELTVVVKRKRTKRPRHQTPASSSESTTTEEEDMAHCLILLAQSASVDSKPSPAPPPTTAPPAPARYTSRKYTEAVTTADGVKAGFYVYECKTCSKCFPTFQALGGHRASHKKPRVADDEDAVVLTTTTTSIKQQQQQQQQQQKPPMMMTPLLQPHTTTIAVFPDVTNALTLNTSATPKLRVHECSICGAEFASGQALGGHMRRHRPLNAPERAVNAAAADTTKKEAGINLELDLNLPAPSDEPLPAVLLGLGQLGDGNKAAGLMLTASALVDCHY